MPIIRSIGIALGVMLLIFAVFMLWLFTPVYAGERCAGQLGKASWYGPHFHGHESASGEVFDRNAPTAAHKTLPFGARVKVTRLFSAEKGAKTFVVVRVNDRGPYKPGRIIDLSESAAAELGLIAQGVGKVCVQRVR